MRTVIRLCARLNGPTWHQRKVHSRWNVQRRPHFRGVVSHERHTDSHSHGTFVSPLSCRRAPMEAGGASGGGGGGGGGGRSFFNFGAVPPAAEVAVAADALPPRESEGVCARVSPSEPKSKKLKSTFLSGLCAGGHDRDDEDEEDEQPISTGTGRASRAVPFAPYCPSKVTPGPPRDTGTREGRFWGHARRLCRRAPPQLRAWH